ncbi:hypothetical protein SDC9_66229 [bioreactor metagenome]|uniref:Uncharacterized protein n=1 Tax=bioreactor metagenome TaxID=1076179 RepID=A0A644XZW2_9ZZZZ
MQLFFCLDTFCQDFHSQVLRCLYDALDQGLVLIRTCGDSLHEFNVDLQLVDRIGFQSAEGGVAGSKVIDGQAEAELLQLK